MATDDRPTDLTDLPIQPTGSGVADAEIARMAAELADGDAAGRLSEDATRDRPTETQA